jgi:hypothetical protein
MPAANPRVRLARHHLKVERGRVKLSHPAEHAFLNSPRFRARVRLIAMNEARRVGHAVVISDREGTQLASIAVPRRRGARKQPTTTRTNPPRRRRRDQRPNPAAKPPALEQRVARLETTVKAHGHQLTRQKQFNGVVAGILSRTLGAGRMPRATLP